MKGDEVLKQDREENRDFLVMTVAEIDRFLHGSPTKEDLAVIAQDARKGVQQKLRAYEKRCRKAAEELQHYKEMCFYEHKYLSLPHINYIAGVDEAGRGPLAGPLVVAAVILREGTFIPGLDDSKKLSAVKREKLYPQVLEAAEAVVVDIVSVSHIDEANIYQATKDAMGSLLDSLEPKPQVALVDAMEPVSRGVEVVPLVHGDAISVSIAAASVVAKVIRDRIMCELDEIYPVFGFKGNKGYGSREHMEAIDNFGPTAIHRRSYEPVKSMHLPPVKFMQDYIIFPKENPGAVAEVIAVYKNKEH